MPFVPPFLFFHSTRRSELYLPPPPPKLHSDPGVHPTAFMSSWAIVWTWWRPFMDMVAQRPHTFSRALLGIKNARVTCNPLALTLSPGPLTPCSGLLTLLRSPCSSLLDSPPHSFPAQVPRVRQGGRVTEVQAGDQRRLWVGGGQRPSVPAPRPRSALSVTSEPDWVN